MGKLDRLETNFVTKFVLFIQDRGTEDVEILTFNNNQRFNKYYSGLNKSISKR